MWVREQLITKMMHTIQKGLSSVLYDHKQTDQEKQNACTKKKQLKQQTTKIQTDYSSNNNN